jgi:hypothetical protein
MFSAPNLEPSNSTDSARMDTPVVMTEVISVETKPHVKRSDVSNVLPLEERIRLRARELYVGRGNQSGSEMDDWLQAEEELSAAEEERVERD